jgi:lipopolysaccharide/colanic/teichoic acid biosynthesis glycosyltransferase
VKRVVDLVLAVVGIVATLPLWVGAAIAIKLQDGGTVLYRAKRAGKDGVPFEMYKFRTMTPAVGPAITRSGDARITRVGRT